MGQIILQGAISGIFGYFLAPVLSLGMRITIVVVAFFIEAYLLISGQSLLQNHYALLMLSFGIGTMVRGKQIEIR